MRFLRDLFGLSPARAAAKRIDERRRAAEQSLVREAERVLNEIDSLKPRATGSRNLVMGLAAGYGEAELAPFVLSLRRSGYQGDVVLLTYGCSAETAAFLRSHQARIAPFTALSAMPMSMNSARMFRYFDWLLEAILNAEGGCGYNRILLSDVRDVVFQGDPFAQATEGRVLFFLESGRTIGDCPINSDWVQRAYGAAILEELSRRPISCAGTVIGSPDGLLEYLAHMLRHIVAVVPEHRFSGVDQAIHNFILAKELVSGSSAIPNGRAVMTVPTTDPTGLRMLSDGRIANPDGSISEIVHQYDRDSAVTAAILARYGR